MMRQRQGAPSEEESSSDEEDAFSKLSKKNKKGGKKTAPLQGKHGGADIMTTKNAENETTATLPAQAPRSITSSMKRHHVPSNDSRKVKMDALLRELEVEKARRPVDLQQDRRGFVPEKKGSFVDPSEEHLTTNLFVGNLSPSLTEEEVTDVFRQFGDLYSVKIMWPRSEEERRRNRNTGFVCFMKRDDAEEALAVLDERCPFNDGRRLMLRWGKNVKKIIKRGTGGVAIAPIRKRSTLSSHEEDPRKDAPKRSRTDSTCNTSDDLQSSTVKNNPFSSVETFDPAKHEKSAVRVEIPSPPARAQFIATIASFIAKDGTALENKLLEMERENPEFSFLVVPPLPDANHKIHDSNRERLLSEHIFYRWRTYSFCQGDSFNVWRTEPFKLLRNGFFWIPPPLDTQAAQQEEQQRNMREEAIERQKKERRRRGLPGRQREQARQGRLAGAADGNAQLTIREVDLFNLLLRTRLCASRESICEAMAFCYEKSGAAKQIAGMLKEALLEDDKNHPGISLETRIARLYVLSDVLFNSQQPGVRNAFLYRNSIEKMAPDIFTSLGKHGSGTMGRITRNKLSTAVSAVLGAWTNWGVYDPVFLDELHARFEGREIKKEVVGDNEVTDKVEETAEEVDVNAGVVEVFTEQQRQDWTAVNHESEENEAGLKTKKDSKKDATRSSPDEKSRNISDSAMSADKDDDTELDGEALDEGDLDGEALEEEDLDGEELSGEELDGEELDGEALEDGNL